MSHKVQQISIFPLKSLKCTIILQKYNMSRWWKHEKQILRSCMVFGKRQICGCCTSWSAFKSKGWRVTIAWYCQQSYSTFFIFFLILWQTEAFFPWIKSVLYYYLWQKNNNIILAGLWICRIIREVTIWQRRRLNETPPQSTRNIQNTLSLPYLRRCQQILRQLWIQ